MYWRVLGVVAILCLLVVALLYAVRSESPSAVVSPGTVATSSSTSSSASAPASQTVTESRAAPALASRGGFIVALTGDQLGIRREQSADLVRTFTTRRFAVSPDGRKVAYWQTGPEDALPHILHVIDLASGQDQVVVTLTNERAGSAGWIVWSTDDNSLALAVSDPSSARPNKRMTI